MGRVKSKLAKRTAGRLMKEQEFAPDFNENKQFLGLTMPSKRIRNIIAGYITRLKKRENYTKHKLSKQESELVLEEA